MDTKIENVGIVQVIQTIEPDPENKDRAIATFWLSGGQKIGCLSVARQQTPTEKP